MFIHLTAIRINNVFFTGSNPFEFVRHCGVVQYLNILFSALLFFTVIRLRKNLNIPSADSDLLPALVFGNDFSVREIKIFGVIFRFLSHDVGPLL
ncbi:hypothetical protein D3C77_514530 [compost metagenome]